MEQRTRCVHPCGAFETGARIHAVCEEKCYAPESVLIVEHLPSQSGWQGTRHRWLTVLLISRGERNQGYGA